MDAGDGRPSGEANVGGRDTPSGAPESAVSPDKRAAAAGVVTLTDKLSQFTDYWGPRTVAQFNGHDVMVVKVKGEFARHTHDETDDFFLVLQGRLILRLPDREIVLNPGELYVVPRGVPHQPFAADETHLLLIEPKGTPNTGDPETAAPRRLL